LSDLVCQIRSEKLPDIRKIANAGSFFKNPLVSADQYQQLKNNFPGLVAFVQPDTSWKLSAAWMIDYLGWKGRVEGNVAVYENHALVIITNGKSCQREVLSFAKKISNDVSQSFGVELEIEPVVL
jgi:UDP-N-acetylmuramate dehydrogenase